MYDVIISGGAMIGSTLALALNHLSNQTLRIAIIEPYKLESNHSGFDARSIALSYGTVKLLKQFDLWHKISPIATAIEDIHVSDRYHAGISSISKQELNIPALGYVVELAKVGKVFHQQITMQSMIDLHNLDRVQNIIRNTKHVNVTLTSGTQLTAKLLVAADGALSESCSQIGLELTEHDFGQVAIIANVQTQLAHNGRAFERFTTNGPIAFLPMKPPNGNYNISHHNSVVWCVGADQAKHILNLANQEFLSLLQHEFGWRLGKLEQVGNKDSYPLILRERKQNISHRFAVIGNAAQTLHPVAGQGFNLGIRDLAILAQELLTQLDDVGKYQGLQRFSKQRKFDRKQTINLITTLISTFSNDLPIMQIGRNLGLMTIDAMPVLKKSLIARTLGLVN